MVTEIPWNDGTSDKIYLTYTAASGDQTILVSSDANAGPARTKDITFVSSIGNISRTLTVLQESGMDYVSITWNDVCITFDDTAIAYPDPTPKYVQDGLVFWLDGIEKGPDNTVWVDKIGGIMFTNHGATFNDDHVSFDGVDDYLDNETYISPSSTTGTIEVCFENFNETKTVDIFLPASSTGILAFGLYYNSSQLDVIWSYQGQRPMYNEVVSKGTISVNSDRGIVNGSAMTYNRSNYWSAANGPAIIGANKPKNRFINGKIYCIRMYDRILTQDEILHNQAVDNMRFNLGLNIT